jgi:hypothetical protein
MRACEAEINFLTFLWFDRGNEVVEWHSKTENISKITASTFGPHAKNEEEEC